jgi:hypothetical protein
MFPLVPLSPIRARENTNQVMTRVLGVVPLFPLFPLFPLVIPAPPIGPLSLREKPAAGKAEEREKRPAEIDEAVTAKIEARHAWTCGVSTTHVLGPGSGTFRAVHWPEAPSFGMFWRLRLARAKADCRLRG